MQRLFSLICILVVSYVGTAQVVDRYPYIQSPDQNSVIIAWNNATAGIGIVNWGTDSNSLTNVVSDTSSTQTHGLSITGLQPNTKYFYQATCGGFQSAKEYFFTAKPDNVRQLDFVVYGDCGFNSSVEDSISEHMREIYHDFGIVVGDVDQISGNNYDVNYFPHYTKMTKNICHFTTIGNHDTLTNQTNYTDAFYLPHNNPANSELYYSFTWGNARFIALDGNMDVTSGSVQYDWLESQLKCNTSEWVFVFFHQPPWTNAWDISYYIPIQYWYQYQGNVDMRTSLVPLFEKYHVDAILNGHAHDYQRGVYNGVHYFIAGGGGTTTPDTHTNTSSPNIQYEQDLNNFMHFSINGDSVHFYALGLNGAPIDSGSFTKTYVSSAVSITTHNVGCGTLNNGSALISGLRTPYSFNWSTGSTADSIAQLTAGTYYVTITDSSGCIAYDSVIIGTTDSLTHVQITESTTGLRANLDALQSNAGSYTWVLGNGVTLTDTSASISYTYSSGGSYLVELITTQNCGNDTSYITVNVTGDSTVGVFGQVSNELDIKVFPNPFSGQTFLNVSSSVREDFSAIIYDIQGRQLRNLTGTTGTMLMIPANDMASGVYLLVISTATAGSTVKLLIQ